MKRNEKSLTISQVSERAGITASALRFYETKGLISSTRTAGNQRRYHSSMLRKISIIQVAQKLGVTLKEIAEAFESLPDNRNPTKKDWDRLALQWGKQLDQKIAMMERLRTHLNGCIGCGCLSVDLCALVNPDDALASRGSGPHYVLEEIEFDPSTEQSG